MAMIPNGTPTPAPIAVLMLLSGEGLDDGETLVVDEAAPADNDNVEEEEDNEDDGVVLDSEDEDVGKDEEVDVTPMTVTVVGAAVKY